MNHLRIAAAVLALVSTAPALAQAPAGSSVPVVSARGEAIAREEFEHRVKLGALFRELEELTLATKIEKEKAEAEKLRNAAKGIGVEPALEPLLPRTAGGGRGKPTLPGIVPPTTPLASLEPDEPATPPPPPPPPPLPKAIGVIGGTVVFRSDEGTRTASTGEIVGGYMIESVIGRTVNLRLADRPDHQAVISAP